MLDELGEPETSKLLSLFTCPINPDVESFLHNNAIMFEGRDTTRTYLMISDAGEIYAFFSLATKELTLLNTNLSKTTVKKIHGANKHAERVPAFLIGQIAKNHSITDNPIRLRDILNEAYGMITLAKEIIGGRVVILECEDNDKLISMYVNHGFTRIDISNSQDSLVTLYKLIIH
ncbi:acetyltransferase [Providencia rettgeri]